MRPHVQRAVSMGHSNVQVDPSAACNYGTPAKAVTMRRTLVIIQCGFHLSLVGKYRAAQAHVLRTFCQGTRATQCEPPFSPVYAFAARYLRTLKSRLPPRRVFASTKRAKLSSNDVPSCAQRLLGPTPHSAITQSTASVQKQRCDLMMPFHTTTVHCHTDRVC